MNIFILYVVGYLLSLIGYVIRKLTSDETKEIENYVTYAIRVFLVILFGSLMYVSYFSIEFILTSIILILVLLSEMKFYLLKELNYLLLFVISFFTAINFDQIWLFSLIILIMTLEHSQKQYSRKEFFYSLGFLLILYALGVEFL